MQKLFCVNYVRKTTSIEWWIWRCSIENNCFFYAINRERASSIPKLFWTIVNNISRLQVKCSHKLCRKKQVPSMGFSEIAEVSFLVGPEPLRKYSKQFKYVNACIGYLFRSNVIHSKCKNVIFEFELEPQIWFNTRT